MTLYTGLDAFVIWDIEDYREVSSGIGTFVSSTVYSDKSDEALLELQTTAA
jgi:hypothetical protein